MSSYENAFDIPLLQDRIKSLGLDGFIVYTTVEYGEATGDKTYGALVVPADDHQQLLHELNIGRRFSGTEKYDYLPDEFVTSDPRFALSNSAYTDLTVSEERAVYALDGFEDPDEFSSSVSGRLN
jgi:hypothetical protein